MKKRNNCSFCGKYPAICMNAGRHQVVCQNCSTGGPKLFNDTQAIEAWNKMHGGDKKTTMSIKDLAQAISDWEPDNQADWPVYAVINGQEGQWDVTQIDADDGGYFVIVLDAEGQKEKQQ